MRINELITEFTIQTSNEEKDILGKLKSAKNLDTFMERDQEVINQLIRKSLVRKIEQDNNTMVVANAGQETR
jgi:DNA-binding MltR family transcriptional regulator|tara:strand:+ start:1194 stop:1409 length:216 start_codon:yes stop_codon:yes gene_type:complete